MGEKQETDSHPAIQKRIGRQNQQIRTQINQHHDNNIPYTFASEENIMKFEIPDKKYHELKEELSNQK